MATLTEQLKWLVTADGSKAISAFENVGKSADKNLGTAEKRIDKLSGQFTKAGAGMITGAAVLGGALIKSASSFEKLGVASAKFAATTGTTTQQASRLIEVTGDIGVSSDELASSLNKMNKTLGSTPALFDKYHVSVARAKDGTTDVQQTFLNVVDRLNAIKDPAERAAAATALLGKGWTGLSELISQGSDQIKTSLAAVSDAKVIDPSEADDAKKYRASLDALSDSFDDLTLAIGQGAAPVIGKIAEVVATAVDGFAKLDAITGGVAGKVAAIGAVGVTAAGGLSLVIGAALKVRENLAKGTDFIAGYTKHLALKSTAETVDAAATTASSGAATTKAGALAAETAAVEANTAAVEANSVANTTNAASGNIGGFGTVGTVVAIGASIGAIAGEAAHANAATGELNKNLGRLNAAPVEQLQQAFDDFTKSEFAASQQDPAGQAVDLVKKNGAAAQRVLEGLHSGSLVYSNDAQLNATFTTALAAALDKQAESAGGAASATGDASDASGDLNAAQQAVNDNVAEGASLLDGLSASTYSAAQEASDLADAQQHSTDVLKAHTKAQEDDKKALDDARSAALAAIDAKYADRKATGDAADAVGAYLQSETDLSTAIDKSTDAHKRYGDKSKTTKKADEEAADAAKKFADSTDEAYDSVLNKADADARAAGAADGSQQAIDGQIKSLSDQAAALAPGSPLRQRIEEYISDLNSIPRSINTDLHVSRSGEATVNVGGKIQLRAQGGPVTAGEPYIVGDGGRPELFVPDQSGVIIPSIAQAGRTQNITHTTTPAAPTAVAAVAVDAGDAAADAVKEQDRLQAALFETGRIGADAYKQYVQSRLASSKDLSDDYLDQYRLLQRLNDQNDDLQKNMHDLGVTTDADYKAYLASRLANFEAYTNGYTQVYKQIQQIDADEAAAQKKKLDDALATTKALYEQAQAQRNAGETEADRVSAENDVNAAGAAGNRVQKDRNASAEDKARAVQDVIDSETKLADTTYKAVLASASSAGLDTGTVEWDRFVRSALQEYITKYGGLPYTVGPLQSYLSGIPALAKGGIVMPTPGGTLVRAGEAGQAEAVIPLDGTSLGGGDTHIHVTVNAQTLTGMIDPRVGDMIASAVERSQRRNGRRSLASVG